MWFSDGIFPGPDALKIIRSGQNFPAYSSYISCICNYFDVTRIPKNLDENTVFLLGMTSKLIYDRIVAVFDKGGFGITVEQFAILGVLWYREGISQQEIAKSVRRDKTTVTRVINTMIRNGLLFRKVDEQDKRIKRIFLTSRGKALQDSTVEASGTVYLQALEGLQLRDITRLNKMLNKIIVNIDSNK